YDEIVGSVGHAVHDLASPRDGLAFLLDRVENEPAWFKFNNQDGWNRHGDAIGYWRTEATALGDLEDRLLKFVVAELRRDLESGQQRYRYLYHSQRNYYWTEKADTFAKTAEEVLASHKQSGAAVKYIADYVYWGLGRGKRAIEILYDGYNQKLLDEGGQAQL